MRVEGMDRVTRVLVAVSAAFVVLGPAARFVDYLAQRHEPQAQDPQWWARMLDLSTEANLPTWWASTLLAGLAGLFAVAGALHRAAGRPGGPYWVLMGVALLLSVDEAVALHEHVLGEVGDGLVEGGGLLHFTWVVPGAALALVVGAAVLRASAALPAAVRRGLVVGGAVFLAGALGAEAVSGAVFDARGHDRVYLVATTVEEGLELAGVVLAIAATRRLIEVRAVPSTGGATVSCGDRPPAVEIGIAAPTVAP